MYDLIVIGGGPAGAAAAITSARQGKRVLLLERGKYPRHKVCGEFVSAESLEILRILLSGTPFVDSRWEQLTHIRRGRLFVDGALLESPIDPPAASIARIDLDAALWEAAVHAGVDARQQQAVLNIANSSGFLVSTDTKEFESRSVIDASGRWSNLSAARTLPAKQNGKRWVGFKAHFAELAVTDSVDLYFFEGGYCGVQPLAITLNGGQINACAMVKSDVASSLPQVLSCHPALQERSRGWRQVSQVVSTAPLIFTTPNPQRDRILLAGDAAGFVDPFVGDGISLALRSGVMAAAALQRYLEERESLEEACQRYRFNYQQKFMPIFRTSSKIRRLFSLPAALRAPMARCFQYTPSLTRYFVQKTR
jgi:flavin-dependent dehydrogenase